MGIRINALTETTSPNNTDNGVLDTSAGTRRITWSNIKTAIFGAINGLTSKSTPVGADVIAIGDSAASFAGKKALLNTLAGAIMPYAKLSDTKATGTDGGTFTTGGWRTRTINTEDNDIAGIVSISANQFTLSAGTYRIRATATAYNVGQNQLRLHNVTDATTTLVGTSCRASGGFDAYIIADLVGEFTISATKSFEIQHKGAATVADTGFGAATSFGMSEVYTVVEIWKVA